MTFADFASWAFFFYLGGCFLALGLSLRSHIDNRVLVQTYGAWIAAAYAAHHFLVPHAALLWHQWWYVWNGAVGAFPMLPAYMLKEAGARKPVMVFAFITTMLCGTYALFSWAGSPLPGYFYFYVASLCEASQVLSMVIWSGPVIPLFVRAWTAITKRSRTWTQHRLAHRA